MGIAKMRHQLLLCSQKDVVTTGGMFVLNREPAFKSWASITAKKGSTFSAHGAAMRDSNDVQTHVIMMRLRTDVDVSHMAWLYEKRLQSAPRWFKVLTINETEQKGSPYWKLSCRLVERGDNIVDPTTPKATATHAMGLPDGVKL